MVGFFSGTKGLCEYARTLSEPGRGESAGSRSKATTAATGTASDRLKPGATLAEAQTQVDALNAANLDRFPEWKELVVNAGFHAKVMPLQEMIVGDVRGILYLLWGDAFFVLLIGALNIANLALVRLTLRRKELATRLALGAQAGQIVRQFIVENVLLTLTGGIAGLAVGAGLLQALATYGLVRFGFSRSGCSTSRESAAAGRRWVARN